MIPFPYLFSFMKQLPLFCIYPADYVLKHTDRIENVYIFKFF